MQAILLLITYIIDGLLIKQAESFKRNTKNTLKWFAHQSHSNYADLSHVIGFNENQLDLKYEEKNTYKCYIFVKQSPFMTKLENYEIYKK